MEATVTAFIADADSTSRGRDGRGGTVLTYGLATRLASNPVPGMRQNRLVRDIRIWGDLYARRV
jgi:hypothetical protein